MTLILLQIHLSAPVPWQYATSQYYRSQSNFILFLYFSRTQLLAYSLEKYLYLVLAPRSTTVQLTHGRERQFGMWNCIATVAKSNQIHVFLILQMNNPNTQDNLSQIQQSLSPTRGITRIFAIFEPFPT